MPFLHPWWLLCWWLRIAQKIAQKGSGVFSTNTEVNSTSKFEQDPALLPKFRKKRLPTPLVPLKEKTPNPNGINSFVRDVARVIKHRYDCCAG